MTSRTDTGRIRTNNEDAVMVDPLIGVAVLADGMGGLEAGEVASAEAVNTVHGFLRSVGSIDERCLVEAIRTANERIFDLGEFGDEIRALGTTLVVWAVSGENRCVIANVGDSRAYRLRDGVLLQLTHDHSLVQQMVDAGTLSDEQARNAVNRNVITRAVGLEREVQVDVRSLDSLSGDLYLLCSDGLTDMLTDTQLRELCGAHALHDAQALERLADELIAAANTAGGADNVSVVAIVVQ